jgi:small ligand-binding sensory domain FIST
MTEIEGAETAEEIQIAVAVVIVNPNAFGVALNGFQTRKLHQPRQTWVEVFGIQASHPLAR